MMPLKEIKVYGLHWDKSHHVDLIRKLWLERLEGDDDHWHFLYEGEYTVFRCMSGSVLDVVDFFKEADGDNVIKEFRIEKCGDWLDNVPITKKYQDEFTIILHGLTVLALQHEEKEFADLLDRVVHCFFNMCWTPEKGKRASKHAGLHYFEAMSICFCAIRRQNIIGFLSGQNSLMKSGKAMLDKQQEGAEKL